ncbi:MAG: hypothetical protein ACK4FJ_10805 [Ferrovibrio sp.]|uniref:hypothetical protein n=1 Tax=Ferrovibrio sp. TaxID=1917215 RepID=UPI0039188E06
MSPFWKHVVPLVALLSLAGPALVPGFNLYELYTTGETDDYGEFCDDVDNPHFVLGAARSCELSLRQVGLFAVFSYVAAIPVAFVCAIILAGFAGLWRRR